MASTFKRLVIWRSVFLFFELETKLRIIFRTRFRIRVKVGLRLGLGVRLGASELLIADCRYAIRGDQVPVAGTGYMTLN